MKIRKRLILLILLLGLLASGCQTFSLTKEEFELQRQGKTVDPEVGTVVEVAGTIGYMGAMIGAAAAALK
jgi:hypothetical protein